MALSVSRKLNGSQGIDAQGIRDQGWLNSRGSRVCNRTYENPAWKGETCRRKNSDRPSREQENLSLCRGKSLMARAGGCLGRRPGGVREGSS
ncbi:hypothetical protein IG631_14321 [Alternaria alternata]|nr:hypothetical protein IG631_14321 [Alternaria alternata]